EISGIAEDHEAVIAVARRVAHGDDLGHAIAVEIAHRHAAIGLEIACAASALGLAWNWGLTLLPQHAAADREEILPRFFTAAVHGAQHAVALVVRVAERGEHDLGHVELVDESVAVVVIEIRHHRHRAHLRIA